MDWTIHAMNEFQNRESPKWSEPNSKPAERIVHILTGTANQLNQGTNVVFLFTLFYLVDLIYVVCMVHNKETQPEFKGLD